MKWLFQRESYVKNTRYLLKTKFSYQFFIKHFSLLVFYCALTYSIQAQNPIANENALPGNPESEWDVINAGDPTIQGFATDMSVNKGSTVRFKINISGSNKNYSIRIYRLGYYQGNGARLVANLGTLTGVTQPSPITDAALGLLDCSNWSESASWAVPSSAVSGIYLAKLVRSDNGGSSHITFVVRDDAGNAPILFKTSDATWQAYNNYGGSSFYLGTTGNPEGRAHKVSYNRPFFTRNIKPECFLFNAEYPMLRWMERNGYDMCYATDIDMERDQSLITPAKRKILLSVGHDEYWSAGQRNKFEAARNAGVHLAFFSGNEVYWKTRWENNTRTVVCYKEGATLGQGEFNCGGNCDPLPGVWTGLWRQGCEYGEDGCRPENALTGQLSWTESSTAIRVPDTYKNHPFWRNTSIATLGPGQTATLTDYTLGYEWNYEQPEYESHNPPGRVTLSSTTFNGKTHKLSLYTHSSGAMVFGAGTLQWSWGLDDVHDREKPTPSRDMQQATLNLFLDMGVTPGTPQPNLIISGSTGDLIRPVSVINNPNNNTTVQANTPLTISGTASDASGIARVDISTDGGINWQAANGTSNWNFIWTPISNGTVTLKSRATDLNGNVELAGTAPSQNAINIVVAGASSSGTPYSIFTSQIPAITNQRDNTIGIVVGTRFRSSANGSISAIRFYKGAGNTGTHIGQLWSSSGTLLAQATFTNETGSGWQQVNLPTPVSITAGTSYIVSYHSSQGYYSTTGDFFANTIVNGPLTAPADISGTHNGLYKYSTVPVFPNETYGKENYFVDVVFSTGTVTDITAPVVTAVSPLQEATGVNTSVTISADFNEALDPASVSNASVFLMSGSSNISGTVTYNSVNNRISFTPASALANGVSYTMTLKGGTGPARIKDLAGNSLSLDYVWSFTTAATPVQTSNCPCTIFTSQLPDISNQRDNTIGIVLGTRFRPSQNGTVSAIRFYKGFGNTGTHIGQLWTSSGTLLAQATFTNETSSGWQQVSLTNPVAITAGTNYIVSYFSSQGYYSTTPNFFANTVVNGLLTAPADINGAHNGVYKYSGSPVFPNETYGKENYFVDVVFNNVGTPVIDLTPPVSVINNPVHGASHTINLPLTISGTASDAGGLNRVEVSTNNGTSWQPASGTSNWSFSWTPSALGSYTIKSRGIDNAGNVQSAGSAPAANAITVNVTAPTANNCPCTLFSGTQPIQPTGAQFKNDGPALEIGTKFSTTVNGYITGLRFYKASGNSGTHIGQLFSNTGTLLAQATFTNETASGWQQVNLSTPIAVTAGTPYIVAYHSSAGYYSTTQNYFNSAVVNGPLRGLANGENGGNGLYRYNATPVFPNGTYLASNYWVDVVFNTVISSEVNRNGANQFIVDASAPSKKFYLLQNAPNPSSGRTTIKYNVPVKAQVSIGLFDIQGRQVRVLVNALKEPGEYSLELDTKLLAKGIYYYKMKADDFLGVKRLVVE